MKRLRDWIMEGLLGVVLAIVTAVVCVAYLTRGPW